MPATLIADGFGLGEVVDFDRAAAFVAAYRARVPLTDAELLDAARRRLWTLAQEGPAPGQHLEQIFAARQRFLRWWTAHRPEVDAALTVPARRYGE